MAALGAYIYAHWIQEYNRLNPDVDFTFTVETTAASETFTIPCQDVGVFSATVDWGDNSSSTITTFDDADLTHTYANAGTHTIRVSGTFPNIYFNDGGDAAKVRTVTQLGEVGWTRLNNAFYGCTGMTSFAAGDCDTSSVINAASMLRNCPSLMTADVSTMDLSSVTNISSMFRDSSILSTVSLAGLNTSLVTSMDSVFRNCAGLTSITLTGIDTGAVQQFDNMFRDCTSVVTIAGLGSLDTSAATSMNSMLRNCSAVGLSISGWNIALVADFTDFLTDASLDQEEYNSTLVNWSAQSVQSSLTASFGSSNYTADVTTWAAREDLTGTHSWTISDGGAIPEIVISPTIDNLSPAEGDTLTGTVQTRGTPAPTIEYQWEGNDSAISGETGQTITLGSAQVGQIISFDSVATNSVGSSLSAQSEETAAVTSANFGTDLVFTVETTTADETFTIPCNNSGTFNATIDWGDGGGTSSITTFDDADLAHTYATAGTHTVRISGQMPNIRFNNTGDKDKVRQVLQMGSVSMTACDAMWRGCTGMTSFNAAPCDLTGAFNLNGMLRQCSGLLSADFTGMTYAGTRNIGNICRDCSSLATITGANDLASGGMDSATEAFTGVPATDFDISGWDVSDAALNLVNLFGTGAAGLTTARYDAVLIAWSAQTVNASETADFGPSLYTPGGTAETARNTLTGSPNLWTINDGGAGATEDFGDDFVMTVQTTGSSETFTIPCQNNGVFNASIDWGDTNSSTITSFDDADLTHSYATAGTYTIRISGDFPNIYFNNAGDAAKVRTVAQLGRVNWTSLQCAFYGCTGLTSFTVTANDGTPNVSNFESMLRGCTGLTSCDITALDTGSATNYANMLRDCSALTSIDVSTLNFSSVTTISGMFYGMSSLTSLAISGVSTGSVTNMSDAFRGLSSLTSLNVASFNTSAVTTMENMFNGCTATDINPSGWNVAVCGEFSGFMTGTGMLTSTYDALLVNWAAQTVQFSETPDFGTSQYTEGGDAEAGRTTLTNTYSWVITDGGGIEAPATPTVDQYFGSSAVTAAQAANPASGGGRGYVTSGGGLDDAPIGDPDQTIYISNRPGAKSSGTSSESDPLNYTAGMAAYNAAAPSGSDVNLRVLFERGYTYSTATRLKPNNVGGVSQTQPLRIGAFGTGSKPRFTNVTTWGGSPKGFVLMKDVELGDSLLVNNAMGEHLRIEDCNFNDGPASLAIQTSGIGTRLNNVTLRGNKHTDVYRADSATQWDLFADRIQGLYFFGVSTILVENCLFDQIAWKEGYNANESAGPMPPSKWSHGVYNTTGNEDVTYNGCVFTRCSSFGLQMRSGGDIYNCLFADNNIISNPSGDYVSSGTNDGNNSTLAGNVFLRPSTKNATNIGARGRGIAPDNRLLMLDNVAVGNDDGFDVWLVSNGNTALSDNTIVDGWGDVSNQNVPGSVGAPYSLPSDFYTSLRNDWTTTRDEVLQAVRTQYGVSI